MSQQIKSHISYICSYSLRHVSSDWPPYKGHSPAQILSELHVGTCTAHRTSGRQASSPVGLTRRESGVPMA